MIMLTIELLLAIWMTIPLTMSLIIIIPAGLAYWIGLKVGEKKHKQ